MVQCHVPGGCVRLQVVSYLGAFRKNMDYGSSSGKYVRVLECKL